ncbi:MAG: sulfatase-like hydrolase/transferase [Chloroflexi bacterium]|nr:sulfatase-like hydrolase/transferase [Chloroflexota bacterium]
MRPNILLILADDLGYGDLGCFGNADARTPSLDRLAEEGIRLTQHYSGSAVCAPARACLMTGRYPHRTGAIDLLWTYGRDRLALDETTLADVLGANGYATGLVGKWHLGAFDPRYHPNRRGFQEFIGFHYALIDYYQWKLDRNGVTVPADGRYVTDVFTDEAVAFIRRHGRGGAAGVGSTPPFFLYLAYNAPHGPLQAPEGEIRPFRETGTFDERVATIYGMNARMDRGIGAVLDELERQGLAENTIVVVSSDNGPAPFHTGHTHGDGPEFGPPRFNAGLRGHKYLVYEGGIRVPAIVRWPAGLPRGATSGELVHFADWFPTLLDAAGIVDRPVKPLDGASVLAALRGEASTDDRPRFWQWNRYHPIRRYNTAVREGDWKLVFPAVPGVDDIDPEEGRRLKLVETDQLTYAQAMTLTLPEPDRHALAASFGARAQLFNLADDPYERENRAAAEPALVERLTRAHDSWFDAVDTERRTHPDVRP